jgi:DNA (cytosine-5)-methyltransferase 1
VCGGFPCQDVSVAGSRLGMAGARSGLWAHFARIIGDVRPKYAIVENVSALLVWGLSDVLGDLATLGYDAEWHCIPASAIGAPHRRDRVWIVAYPDRRRRPVERLTEHPDEQGASGDQSHGRGARGPGNRPMADTDGASRDSARRERATGEETICERATQLGRRGAPLADSDRTRLQGWDCRDMRDGAGEWTVRSRYTPGTAGYWWLAEPPVGRVANGIPARVDRLRCLGNAIVPQIAEMIGNYIGEDYARTSKTPADR